MLKTIFRETDTVLLRNPQRSRGNFNEPVNSSTNCLFGVLLSDYGERIRKAHKDWEIANDPEELSWAEVARQCAALLEKPVDPSAVIRWKQGKQEPSVAEFRALAQVFKVTPSWLAFGQFPIRPAEEQPPLSPEPVGKREVRSKRRGE